MRRRTITKLFKGNTLEELELSMQTWIDAKEDPTTVMKDFDPLPTGYKLRAQTATPFTVGEVQPSQLALPPQQQQMKLSFCLMVIFSIVKP